MQYKVSTYLLIFYILIESSFTGFQLNAQNLIAKADQIPQYQSVIEYYQKQTGLGSPLFVGKEFIGYDYQIEGHAFFDDEWREGSIQVDGILYINVSMRYDLLAEAVLIDHDSRASPIQLESDRVGWFVINNHHFVHLRDEEIDQPVLNTGFYDVLAEGKVDLLVKRKKILKKSIDDTELRVLNWFEDRNEFYVVLDQAVHKIKSKRNLLNALTKHRKEVNRILRQNNIEFRGHAEQALVMAVNFYNQQK